IGAFTGIGQANRTRGEARGIADLPSLDAAMLAASSNGTAAVITGILSGDSGDDLVIYAEQEWQIEYDEDDGWQGSWQTLRTVVPDCRITLADGSAVLNATRNAIVDRTLHEAIVYVPAEGQAHPATEVDGVVKGTIRHLGFRSGDQITAVGVTALESFTAERLSGGDHRALMQHLSQQVTMLRIVGVIFGLVGLGLMGAAAALLLRP
ncbi:MAG: hypothetical protein MUF84_11325, partial [Anaerolineae bacterium]|nr:hypothetical protein [Anaerolineae bacterium]